MNATQNTEATPLPSGLEDTLETLFLLLRDGQAASTKDIARAREANLKDVSAALAQLKDLGLIQVTPSDALALTAEGEKTAIRTFSRHRLLLRLFEEILAMPPAIAEANACAMEHSLNAEGMDHVEKFIEFVRNTPEGSKIAVDFRKFVDAKQTGNDLTVADLKAGQRAIVKEVRGRGAIRQRLLDMGIMPDTLIKVERRAPAGDPIWVRLQGGQISLRRKESEAIIVTHEKLQ